MADSGAPNDRITIVVNCFDDEEFQLILEPEGSEHTVRKGEPLRVEVAPQPDGVIEVSYFRGGISISAGTGWETLVWDKDGREKQV